MHSWLEEYLRVNGDYDPVNGHIHVPSYVSQETFYDLFRQDCMTLYDILEDDIPSYYAFTHYFRSHFSHVNFLKHTRLRRCTFCMTFHEKRVRCTTDQELIDLKVIIFLLLYCNVNFFQQAAKEHHLLHSSERTLYESRCHQVAQHPENILSLIIDCPQGYNIPHIQPGLSLFHYIKIVTVF